MHVYVPSFTHFLPLLISFAVGSNAMVVQIMHILANGLWFNTLKSSMVVKYHVVFETKFPHLLGCVLTACLWMPLTGTETTVCYTTEQS